MKSNDMFWTFDSVHNFDAVAKNMLVENRIPGIVKMNCSAQNGVIELSYHYHGLYDFVSQEHVKNKLSVLKYIRQIATTATYCSKFLLRQECFLTNLEKIGYSKKNDLVQLVYIPEKTNQQNHADFRSLFIGLLEFGGWHVENPEIEKFWNYLTDADKLQFNKIISFCDKATRDLQNRTTTNTQISDQESAHQTNTFKPKKRKMRGIPKHMRVKTNMTASQLQNPQVKSTQSNFEPSQQSQSNAIPLPIKLEPAPSAAYEIPAFNLSTAKSQKSKKSKPENPSLIWLLSNYSKENKEYYNSKKQVQNGESTESGAL